MTRLDWRDFGAVGDGTTDCTQAINDCFQAAIDTGMEAYGPAGEYKITDQLVWGASPPRISGAGSLTIIKADANDYDWLTIGNGTTVASGPGTGWIRDVFFIGANTTLAPSGTTAGLTIDAIRGVEIRGVHVSYAPIGFQLKNNCFGSSFYNCRTLFDRCRIGIDLRGVEADGTTPASGNDIPFFNCWFDAREAGVKMSRRGGFYRFFAGQIGNNGTPADPDNTGTLLVDTTEGNIVATFHGVSFEGANNTWNVRVVGSTNSQVGAKLLFDGCSFFGKTTGTGALGVLKLTGPYDDVITFRDCGVHDTYNGPQLLSIESPSGVEKPGYAESGTYGIPLVGGGQQNLRDNAMIVRAGLPRGFAQNYFTLWFNGLFLRNNGGQLEQATSSSGPWAPV